MGGRSTDRPTGFGVVLKELRERRGQTLAGLAEKAGLNLWGVAKLESGARDPAWRTVLDLAAALGVTPNDFAPADWPPAGPEPAPAKPRARGKRT